MSSYTAAASWKTSTATTYGAAYGMATVPATDKQLAFIKTLLAERGTAHVDAQIIANRVANGKLGKMQASKAIDFLLKLPKLSKAQTAVQAEVAAAGAVIEVTIGLFDTMPHLPADTFASGRYLLIGKTAKGSYVAKKMFKSYSTQSGYSWRKTYYLTAKTAIEQGKYAKLTQEQVGALGKKFAVCMCCSATLSDPASVEAGIGPVCMKKFF